MFRLSPSKTSSRSAIPTAGLIASRFVSGGVLLALMVHSLNGAQDKAESAESAESSAVTGTRWVVILTGLPGDEERGGVFASYVSDWKSSLSAHYGVDPQHIFSLNSPEMPAEKSDETDADRFRKAISELAGKIQPADSLWVFTVGHGNYDGKKAWLHLRGRDPSQDDFARWFSGIKCREQIFWLTHSSSGWFVKPLSRPGRIVMAATAADDESNETEFPRALAKALKLPTEKLDRDGDQQVSVAELFETVQAEVKAGFDADMRLMTEHAQLDDDGDGRGSEDLSSKATPAMKVDGEVARRTWMPPRRALPDKEVPAAESMPEESEAPAQGANPGESAPGDAKQKNADAPSPDSTPQPPAP